MKTLLILRHAKSSWKDESLADFDRPLNARGKEDAPRMGRMLRKAGLTPDLILSSAAKRARKTAEAVAETCSYANEIVFTRELYAADPDTIIEQVRCAPDTAASVMVVAHNPGLELLLEQLTGELQALPTAALAEVRLPINAWAELTEDTNGQLVRLLLPHAAE